MHYLKLVLVPFVVFVISVSIACDGGTNDNAERALGPDPTETPDAEVDHGVDDPSDDGSNAGTGSASLTIGNETWTFVVSNCWFEGEFMDETVLFLMSGTAELSGGGTLVFKATIQDSRLPGKDISHTILIWSMGPVGTEVIRWSTNLKLTGDDDGFLRVDGKRVSAEATFDNDTGGPQDVAGTLEGMCP